MLAAPLATGTITGANALIFGVVFAIAIIFLMLTVTRQTLLTALLSTLSWASLAVTTLACFGSVSMLHIGFMMFCVLVAVVMAALTFKYTLDFLEANLKEKQRKVSEEIM